MTGGIREVGIVIPARNEQELVGRCVETVVTARDELAAAHPALGIRIVVAADTCTDETVREVERFEAAGVELVVGEWRAVGAARAAGTALVVGGRAPHDLGGLWIVNTDADSRVRPDWLVQQVALADTGVDVVVGTVRPDPDDLTREQDATWRRTHVSGHPNGHVHGANLGVRGSVYEAVGGFRTVTLHEDNLLVDALRFAGATIAASDAVEVVTSGRRIGRASGGYAAYLEASLGPAPRDLAVPRQVWPEAIA